MAQGESPRNPLAFASVLCPGRCLASQPTGSGGERAVDSHNHGPWPMILAALCRSAAVSSTSFSAPSSSLPSLRGIFGHCLCCCHRRRRHHRRLHRRRQHFQGRPRSRQQQV